MEPPWLCTPASWKESIETIWTELLSFYDPVTASIENVCGTLDDPLGGYKAPESAGDVQP